MSWRSAALFGVLAGCSDYELSKGLDVATPADTACALSVDTASIGRDDGCVVVPDVGGFAPVVEWQWNTNTHQPGFDDIMSTPAVANLTDDNGDGFIDENDVPDVVFTTFSGGAYTSAGALTAVSGDSGYELWSILTAGPFEFYASGSPAIGDIDHDGVPEVCTAGVQVAVVCVNADSTPKWAGGVQPYGYGAPALADLEGDGTVEVVFGSQILESDGTLRAYGSGGTGWYLSFPVDLDLDGTLEIVAGNTLYNVDGSVRWTDGTADGPSAVGDFDLDGTAEIVHGYSTITVTDVDGVIRWQATVPGGGGGPPTVADFDGDGLPEVGVAGAYYYTVFDTDGAVLWSAPVQDYSSQVTGSSVFDFEGDGAADVVYGDEITLWVYDGATGAVKLQVDDHASGTLYEYPLIVDVDHDGSTEIVLASNNYAYGGWNGITVIGDQNGTWRPSRGIWNQYAYSITNVNDDGSIPTVAEANWLRFNNFRTAGSLYGNTDELADLAAGPPETCTLECVGNDVQIVLPVGNSGLADAGAFRVRVVPADGGPPLLDQTLIGLPAGRQMEVGPLSIEKRDWGSGLFFRVDDDAAVEECDETDNVRDLGAWPCPS